MYDMFYLLTFQQSTKVALLSIDYICMYAHPTEHKILIFLFLRQLFKNNNAIAIKQTY